MVKSNPSLQADMGLQKPSSKVMVHTGAGPIMTDADGDYDMPMSAAMNMPAPTKGLVIGTGPQVSPGIAKAHAKMHGSY